MVASFLRPALLLVLRVAVWVPVDENRHRLGSGIRQVVLCGFAELLDVVRVQPVALSGEDERSARTTAPSPGEERLPMGIDKLFGSFVGMLCMVNQSAANTVQARSHRGETGGGAGHREGLVRLATCIATVPHIRVLEIAASSDFKRKSMTKVNHRRQAETCELHAHPTPVFCFEQAVALRGNCLGKNEGAALVSTVRSSRAKQEVPPR